MSGLFGYADPSFELAGSGMLEKMASRMSHRPWYECTQINDEEAGVGIARIGISIFNQNQGPQWNQDRNAVLFLTGEVTNLHLLSPEPHPEKALMELYEKEGVQFIQRMKGSFLIGVWDIENRRLIIANDRFGTYPLFYSFYSGRLVFAPEMKAVLLDSAIPRSLDVTAAAQYMRFQTFLGDRTFLEAVKFLKGASILTFDASSGHLEINKYWTYDSIPHNPRVSYREAVIETGSILRDVIRRLSAGEHRPGVFLSGGLDSRMILGFLERRPVVTMTYGRKDCRDVRYGGMLARAAGTHHHWHDLPDGKWVEDNVDFHWELTEGMHSWIHMHSISMLDEARGLFDVNLSGMAGGILLKNPKMVEPLKYAAVDDNALVNRMFPIMTVKHTWPGLTEDEERLLYTRSFLQKVQGLAFDSFYEEFSPYLQFRPDVRAEFFYVDAHNMRMINNMAVVARSHIEFRYPFLDEDLFEFVFSLPVQYRSTRGFAMSIIQKYMPAMANIPCDVDEFLPTDRTLIRTLHSIGVRGKRRFNRTFFKLFPEWKTLYADYEEYLRTDLRPWAEGILFDRRTAERGIFEPAYLHTLMLRHCSGMEEWTIGKIAPLITFEMSLRRLLDE